AMDRTVTHYRCGVSQVIEQQHMISPTEEKSLSWSEYASELTRCGARVVQTANGDFWNKHESFGLVRVNDLDLSTPAREVVREALVKAPAAVASYIVKPDENHSANAWWYVCEDRSYAFDKLPHSMRKNVKRGLKEFKSEFSSPDQCIRHGAKPFCDSRSRVGLSDGTEKEFNSRFGKRARRPGHVILGAWSHDSLAAFVFITLVQDWAINEGPFGANEFLHLRPNDALLFWELSYFLTQKKCRGVSAGLSSIQFDDTEKGLHLFKTKAGFEARAIHRVFLPHPLLGPLVNRATLWCMNNALRLKPSNRGLLKAIGVLTCLLSAKRTTALPLQPCPSTKMPCQESVGMGTEEIQQDDPKT
ncbi:hypothetical protein, partial [Nitrospira sp. BLG_2]|uniref:hypothetical protein n=1 Tax=Nitrospira sp. BLG_2 TaxID=3397507 RepID=UPI003B9A11C5